MDHSSFCLAHPATSATATARLGIFAAGPERADEGGGSDARAASLPTPSPFRLRRLLQDFARLFSSSFVGGVTDSEPSRSANRCLSRLIAPSARRPAPSRAREDPAKLLPHLAALLRRAHH